MDPPKKKLKQISSQDIVEKISFMQNGSSLRLEKKKNKIDKPHVVNTCAFDSLYHVLACSSVISDGYRQFLRSLKHEILDFILDIVDKGFIDINEDIFNKRTHLLLKHKLIDQCPEINEEITID